MTTLVTLTYLEGKTTRMEVVDSSGERFVELITAGVDAIELAPDDAPLGLMRSIKKLIYAEDKEKFEKGITYVLENDKIKLDRFEPFTIRGYNVKIGNSKYGQILSVDLRKSDFAVYDRQEANNIVYAIRMVQEFNAELVAELTGDEVEQVEVEEASATDAASESNQ